MPQIGRARMQRIFATLGAAPASEHDRLSDDLLAQFVEMHVEALGHRLTTIPEPSARTKRLARDFEHAVLRELRAWGKHRKNWFARGVDAEDLFYDEGSYAVLMTLRDDDIGITDGRWHAHFDPQIADVALDHLAGTLRRKLSRWAKRGGGGALNASFEADAEALIAAEQRKRGDEELDEDEELDDDDEQGDDEELDEDEEDFDDE